MLNQKLKDMKIKFKILFILVSVIIFITCLNGWGGIFDALVEFFSLVFFVVGLIVVAVVSMVGFKKLCK